MSPSTVSDLALPLALRATDLGITLVVDSLVIDSYVTRVRFKLCDAPFPYTVCGATMTPGCDAQDDGEPLTWAPLPLLRVEAEAGDTEAGWMVFGPFPPEATRAVLVVHRLQVPSAPHCPDIYYNVFCDPFEASDDDALALDLEKAGRRRLGHDYETPPGWECEGRWAVKLTSGRRAEPGRTWVGATLRVGTCTLEVPWMDRGVSGTLIALDYVPPEWAEWGFDWRYNALCTLQQRPFPELPVPPVGRVTIDLEGEVCRGLHTGPYGPLQVRHYLEMAALPPTVTPVLRVEEVHCLRLLEHVEHEFVPRTFEDSGHCYLPLVVVGLEGRIVLEICDVNGDEASFVVFYRLHVESAEVSTAWIAQAWLMDAAGNTEICQGEGLREMDAVLGAQAGPVGARGMLFPPVDPRLPVVLHIETLDVAMRVPPELRLAPMGA